MTPRKHDVANLSGAYVLHALNDDEAALFEAHLAESEETRNEAIELADTAVLLGFAVDPELPSPALKASIMSQLASTPQLAREEPVIAAVPDRFAGRAETKAQARWFAKPVTAIAGIAAAVALIVGGGVVATNLNSNSSLQAEADQLAAIYAAGDSQQLTAAIDGGGQAKLVWSGDLKSSALWVDGVAQLSDDQVYELWYINESGARPAGTFSAVDGGTWNVLEGEMHSGDTVGVTIEPAGGSTTPTTTPIVTIASA